MLLRSNAAAKDFRPNGLLAGLGLTLEEQSLAYNWREHLTPATSTFTPTPEWTARYGPEGGYSKEASVIEAEREEAAANLPEESAPVAMWVMAQCGPSDYACIAENERRAAANARLAHNASLAYNLQVCLNNAVLNRQAGAACSVYDPLPELTAAGERRTVAPTGGQYVFPSDTRTPAQEKAAAEAWTARQRAETAQREASAAANKPNQSVPPASGATALPPASTTDTALERLLAQALAGEDSDGGGKILGMEPRTLMLFAAVGVGALMLLRK